MECGRRFEDGVSWSNKERFSRDQDPANIARLLAQERFPRLGDPGPILRRILERFFPTLLVPPAAPARSTTRGSACTASISTCVSSRLIPFLRDRLELGLDHEDAIEMYYDAALTPWLGATLDLQVIDDLGTSVVLGGRPQPSVCPPDQGPTPGGQGPIVPRNRP